MDHYVLYANCYKPLCTEQEPCTVCTRIVVNHYVLYENCYKPNVLHENWHKQLSTVQELL